MVVVVEVMMTVMDMVVVEVSFCIIYVVLWIFGYIDLHWKFFFPRLFYFNQVTKEAVADMAAVVATMITMAAVM